MIEKRPVDDPVHSVGVAGEVVAEFGGGIGEVAASGLAAAAAGGVSMERVEIAVSFERDAGQALGAAARSSAPRGPSRMAVATPGAASVSAAGPDCVMARAPALRPAA